MWNRKEGLVSVARGKARMNLPVYRRAKTGREERVQKTEDCNRGKSSFGIERTFFP